jgi:hypothetical protein
MATSFQILQDMESAHLTTIAVPKKNINYKVDWEIIVIFLEKKSSVKHALF